MAETLSLQELKELIVESLSLDGVQSTEIEDDSALFGGGLGLDSVDALELVIALEKRLGVKIRSHEMDPQAFGSAASLHRYIQQRTATDARPVG